MFVSDNVSLLLEQIKVIVPKHFGKNANTIKKE